MLTRLRARRSGAIPDDLPQRGCTGCPMSYQESWMTSQYSQAPETTHARVGTQDKVAQTGIGTDEIDDHE